MPTTESQSEVNPDSVAAVVHDQCGCNVLYAVAAIQPPGGGFLEVQIVPGK